MCTTARPRDQSLAAFPALGRAAPARAPAPAPPPPATWACAACSFHNENLAATACEMCTTPRAAAPPRQRPAPAPAPAAPAAAQPPIAAARPPGLSAEARARIAAAQPPIAAARPPGLSAEARARIAAARPPIADARPPGLSAEARARIAAGRPPIAAARPPGLSAEARARIAAARAPGLAPSPPGLAPAAPPGMAPPPPGLAAAPPPSPPPLEPSPPPLEPAPPPLLPAAFAAAPPAPEPAPPSSPAAAPSLPPAAAWLAKFADARTARPALFDFAEGLAALFSAAIQDSFPDGRVEVYGSCASGLANPESDVDLVAYGHPGLARGEAAAVRAMRAALLNARHLWERELRLDEFEVIADARVPLLKLKAHVGGRRVAVDLTIGQPVPVRNSRWLKAYAAAGGKASRGLLVLVKAWAKARGVATVYQKHTPSPFAHCLLVVTYLQIAGVCPNLQPKHRYPDVVDGIDCFFEDPKKIAGNRAERRKKELEDAGGDAKLPALLAGYFEWLKDLKVKNVVVSPRLGWTPPKLEHWRDCDLVRQATLKWRLSIEDPFEHAASPRPHDLGDVLTQPALGLLMKEANRAARLAADGTPRAYEELFETETAYAARRHAEALAKKKGKGAKKSEHEEMEAFILAERQAAAVSEQQRDALERLELEAAEQRRAAAAAQAERDAAAAAARRELLFAERAAAAARDREAAQELEDRARRHEEAAARDRAAAAELAARNGAAEMLAGLARTAPRARAPGVGAPPGIAAPRTASPLAAPGLAPPGRAPSPGLAPGLAAPGLAPPPGVAPRPAQPAAPDVGGAILRKYSSRARAEAEGLGITFAKGDFACNTPGSGDREGLRRDDKAAKASVIPHKERIVRPAKKKGKGAKKSEHEEMEAFILAERQAEDRLAAQARRDPPAEQARLVDLGGLSLGPAPRARRSQSADDDDRAAQLAAQMVGGLFDE